MVNIFLHYLNLLQGVPGQDVPGGGVAWALTQGTKELPLLTDVCAANIRPPKKPAFHRGFQVCVRLRLISVVIFFLESATRDIPSLHELCY